MSYDFINFVSKGSYDMLFLLKPFLGADINNLLKTCTLLYSQYNHFSYYVFNEELTKNYINNIQNNSAYKKQINNMIKHNYQLSLNAIINNDDIYNNFMKLPLYEYNNINITFKLNNNLTWINKLNNIQALILNNINITNDELINLSHIKYIKLDKCNNITDISCLSNVHKLILYHCTGINVISGTFSNKNFEMSFMSITEFNYHNENCESCDINFCNMMVNTLDTFIAKGHFTNLNIKCNSIKVLLECSVNNLTIDNELMSDLKINGCIGAIRLVGTNLTNIDALLNIYKVSILYNKNIENIDALRNSYNVVLFRCPKIKNIDVLRNVNKLLIIKCNKITNFRALHDLHELSLISCNGITDINHLSDNINLKKLVIKQCYKITECTELQGLDHLELTYCKSLVNVSGLKNINTLILDGCGSIPNECLNEMQNIRTFSMKKCKQIIDISKLDVRYSLNVESSRNLININLKNRIYDLNINNCPEVTDVSLLVNKVTKLYINGCSNIMSLMPIINIPLVYFRTNTINCIDKHDYLRIRRPYKQQTNKTIKK